MAIKIIPVHDLKAGMFVLLELAWYEHPFIKNQFILSSEDEIRKIKDLGLKTIKIDLERSQIHELEIPPAVSRSVDVCNKASIIRDKPILSEEFLTVIHDKTLAPQQKAILVQQHSMSMMKDLLENPTADNIQELKKGASEIVDLILRDDATTFYLINITDHDYYTYTHSVNVGFLAVALAKALFRHSSNHDLHALGAGFFLHDLGKVNIDLAIINKPGRLTDEEMSEMKRHPNMGFYLLQETKQMTKELKQIVLQHHEKMNGTGYPSGLKGDDIHIYGRICAIADIFDALTSKRPYKEQMPSFAALKIMKEEMVPSHIQKDLFEKFVLLFKAPRKG
jgi:HD-GYP domain-containing protein (c-di-GMP phosphodiesterase class II)